MSTHTQQVELALPSARNLDAQRTTVGKVLNAGIRIGPREAKLLGVVFGCSQSAIQADVKVVPVADIRSSARPRASDAP